MVQEKSRHPGDPAAEAAGLLLRIGFVILCIFVPVITFWTRRSIVVLVPIGLTTIILASTIIARDFSALNRFVNLLLRVAGVAALCLAIWSSMSLLWTPFPAEAGEKLFKALGTLALALAACLAIPVRMRAPNLHLVTIGIALAASVPALVWIAAYFGYRIAPIEGPTTARAAISLALMVWPAMAWLETRAERGFEMGLMLLVALAVALSGSMLALLTLIVGACVFGLALLVPKAVASFLAAGTILVILGAPFFAAILRLPEFPTELVSRLFDSGTITALQDWGDANVKDPLHLITGHGFETAARARTSLLLAVNSGTTHAASGTIFDIWYELGLIGALCSAFLVAGSFRGCLRQPQPLVAPLLGCMAGACAFALIGNAISQLWFLSSLGVVAITFVAVHNGQHRTIRPKARQQTMARHLPGTAA